MRRFFCLCGQELFIENGVCMKCRRVVGYDPDARRMLALEQDKQHWRCAQSAEVYQLCHNRTEHGVCFGIIPQACAPSDDALCSACRLTRTIPDLSKGVNQKRWAKLERAKRRLLYGLAHFNLPLSATIGGVNKALRFDFLEDKRSNEDVEQAFVTTGHLAGVITVNVMEADDVQRTWQRELHGERYRTVLGHMRHEVGHFYFEHLVRDQEAFAALFGDPHAPYDAALKHHYKHGPKAGWEQHFISAYASSHPAEDWAETFAHYLHCWDALETAMARGVVAPLAESADFEERLRHWDQFSVTLNELNRSLGLPDAYPFVITEHIADKLRFVHQSIGASRP
ncbi:MAG: putative zinc-binding metallopeptidase [Oleiphilaceae bacterium]|nr:putative zinc-binding metallopeptidase [Oleiphilaceae bacterium]